MQIADPSTLQVVSYNFFKLNFSLERFDCIWNHLPVHLHRRFLPSILLRWHSTVKGWNAVKYNKVCEFLKLFIYLGYLLSSMPVHASGRHPVTVVSHGGPEVGADGGSPQDEQGDIRGKVERGGNMSKLKTERRKKMEAFTAPLSLLTSRLQSLVYELLHARRSAYIGISIDSSFATFLCVSSTFIVTCAIKTEK